MTDTINSKVQASAWLKPDQVEAMRTAVYRCRPPYLQGRDDAILALAYDAGLRVGELVGVDVENLRENNSLLYLPGEAQKDYPTASSPTATAIGLSADTTRTLSQYLANRWKDTEALFPSRSSDRMTTQAVRNMISTVAEAADVRPFLEDGSRGDPGDVTPHTLRHSVAYRMLRVEENNDMYDVRDRLRHRSIQTTEQVYDHLDRV